MALDRTHMTEQPQQQDTPSPMPEGTSILSRPNCAQMFFVYPGLPQARNGRNPLFLLHAGLGGRNLAFLRDPTARFFEAGTDKNYPTFESILDWQCYHIDSQPNISEVYTVGGSSGGFSALEMGHHLKVKAVYAFCPRGPGRCLRLRTLLSEWNGVTEYHVYYSTYDQWDTVFAEALLGTPHLTLHTSDPRFRDGHMIMIRMALRGELETVFPPMKTVD